MTNGPDSRRGIEAELRESRAWIASQKEAFEAALGGAPLAVALDILIRTAIEQLGGQVRCAFYLVDRNGRELHHVTGMSESYAACVDGFKVGPDSVACGLAVHRQQPVITADVTLDPQWEPWLWMAKAHGYRACWSFPVGTSARDVLGTLAMYFPEPREATARDLELAFVLTRAASIIVSRHQEAEERARSEAQLRASEEKFRSLFESIDQGVVISELLYGEAGEPFDGRYLEVNRVFAQQTGLSDVVGKRISEVAPGTEPRWFEAYDRGLRTGEPERIEEYDRHTRRWYCAHASRVGGEGSLLFAVVFDDITDRKRHEQRQAFLLKLSDTLRPLVDTLAITAEANRALGEFLETDRAYYVELDYTRGLAIVARDHVRGGAPSLSGTHPMAAFEAVLAPQRAGHPYICEDAVIDVRISDTDRPAYLERGLRSFVTVPLIKSGVLVGTMSLTSNAPRAWAPAEVALVQEVAERTWEAVERARAEAERDRLLAREQEARREAERLMMVRDEFLAVISHELRTPLSSILLWSKMLSAGTVPPAQQSKAFASIEASASAQKKLIDDLLDVSSMLSGQMQLSLRAAEVRPVLEAAVATVRPMAMARGVTLALDLGVVPAVARIDPERLQQIIWNLLTNAVKFTPAGGTVSVRLASLPAVVRVTVEDTGQGIAGEFLPYVFERFRQQDASRTRLHGGLGLGLAIVRQLVELHGGTIAVASAGEGRGATFTVELPRLAHEVAIDAPLASTVDGSASVASYEPDRVLDGVRVLLVEDDAPTRHVLRWLLEQHGAQVTAVATTDEALSTIDGPARFDVLVSDIGLPGKDGYALLAELRQRPGGAGLSALALTAHARPDDCRRVMAAGFDAYLAKPVAPRPLVEAVSLLSRGMTASAETR